MSHHNLLSTWLIDFDISVVLLVAATSLFKITLLTWFWVYQVLLSISKSRLTICSDNSNCSWESSGILIVVSNDHSSS